MHGKCLNSILFYTFSGGTNMPKSMLVIVLISVVLLNNIQADDDVYYVAEFSEDVISCDDFENKVMDCSTLVLENGEEGPALGGSIGVIENLESYDVEINVYKQLDLAQEFVFGTKADMCKSLDDDSAPWFTIFESMNITGCPINAANYPVKDIVINLDFAKDVMNHNFVGDYKMFFELTADMNIEVCYIIQLAIVEKQVEEK